VVRGSGFKFEFDVKITRDSASVTVPAMMAREKHGKPARDFPFFPSMSTVQSRSSSVVNSWRRAERVTVPGAAVEVLSIGSVSTDIHGWNVQLILGILDGDFDRAFGLSRLLSSLVFGRGRRVGEDVNLSGQANEKTLAARGLELSKKLNRYSTSVQRCELDSVFRPVSRELASRNGRGDRERVDAYKKGERSFILFVVCKSVGFDFMREYLAAS